MQEERSSDKIPRELLFQIIIMGISSAGLSIFWYFESGFFNTYIIHVLGLKYIYVAIMVSLSAIMGLIFVFVFGVISDNTRSKLGRRRPYLLFGVLAGLSMILFSFSSNFYWCLIFDVVIIGVAANAYLAASNALVPDIVDSEHRGRANALIGVFSTIAGLFPIIMTLVVYELYTKSVHGEKILTQEGHFVLFLFGGLSIMLCSLITFLFIREPLSSSELPPKKSFIEEIRLTFQFSELKKHREFFKFVIAITIFNIGLKIITIYLYNFLFTLGLETIELILGILIILPIVLFTNLMLGKLADKYGRKKFIAPLIFLASIGCIIMPFIGSAGNVNLILLVIGALFIMLGATSLIVPIIAWQQDLLPDDKRGQFIGLLNITSTLNQIPAAFLAAFIADTFGIQWIFLIVPFFLVGSIPVFISVKETLTSNIE
ncbi:MAG: MFS transporter [Promethearchaeota archaeon]